MGRVAHGLAGLDTEQYLVSPSIVAVQVMAVVGRHQRQLQLRRHLHQALVDDILLRQGVFLQLDIVAIRKLFAVPAGGCDGLLHPPPAALHGHFPLQAGRQGDQPLGVTGQQLPVDTGTIVKALLVTGRSQV